MECKACFAYGRRGLIPFSSSPHNLSEILYLSSHIHLFMREDSETEQTPHKQNRGFKIKRISILLIRVYLPRLLITLCGKIAKPGKHPVCRHVAPPSAHCYKYGPSFPFTVTSTAPLSRSLLPRLPNTITHIEAYRVLEA